MTMYINMIGTFDNVAWALQYEHNLIEGADENNQQRRQIGIYNKKFIEQLKIKDEKLYIELKVHESWYKNLTTFRDPAACRIPLYCPPITISNAKEREEYKDVDKKFSQINYKDNPEKYMELFEKIHKIGTFQPIFIVSSEKEKLVYDLRKITNDDYKNFLEVLDIFFMWIKNIKEAGTG